MKFTPLSILALMLALSPSSLALPVDAADQAVGHQLLPRQFGVYTAYNKYGKPKKVTGDSAGTGMSDFLSYLGYRKGSYGQKRSAEPMEADAVTEAAPE